MLSASCTQDEVVLKRGEHVGHRVIKDLVVVIILESGTATPIVIQTNDDEPRTTD